MTLQDEPYDGSDDEECMYCGFVSCQCCPMCGGFPQCEADCEVTAPAQD